MAREYFKGTFFGRGLSAEEQTLPNETDTSQPRPGRRRQYWERAEGGAANPSQERGRHRHHFWERAECGGADPSQQGRSSSRTCSTGRTSPKFARSISPLFGRGLSVEEQTRPKGGYPCSALIGTSAWNPLTIVGPEMMVEIQAVATTSRRRRRLR